MDLVDETLLERDGVVVVRVRLAAAVQRPFSPATAYFFSDYLYRTDSGGVRMTTGRPWSPRGGRRPGRWRPSPRASPAARVGRGDGGGL
jgi:hypothetical protein